MVYKRKVSNHKEKGNFKASFKQVKIAIVMYSLVHIFHDY